MAPALTDYQTRIRQFLDDTVTSHKVTEELTTFVTGGNGARKTFSLSHANLVTGATQADVNLAGFLSTGFTVDTVNGAVTFTVAPPLSTSVPTSLFIRYYYQEFTDADLAPFIDYGLNKIGVNGSAVDASYSLVTPSNFNVVCLYGASAGYQALASRYAKFVNTGAEGKSSGKSSISTMYKELSKEYETRGDAERIAVQGPRQGRSTVASVRVKSMLPPSANWTPGR